MYTIDRTIRHAGLAFADNEAVVHGTRRQTYAELAARVDRAISLVSSISAPGDRIALWSLNSDSFLELFLAIPAAGRVIVPHNTRWAEPELAYATQDAGARLLFADRDPAGLSESVDRVIRIDTGEYDDLLADPGLDDGGGERVVPAPDDLAGLFYTGGTTGRSKGVMLTHANLMANAIHVQLAQPLVPDDRYLTMAPMFHAAGLYSALALPLVGGTNVILPGFAPDAVLDAIVDERITCAIAVPTMLAAMCETQAASPRDMSSLRWISHGASPIALEVLRRADQLFGCELIHLYGATETAPIAAVFRHEEQHLDDDLAKSCGQAPPGVEIRIVDATGAEVADGHAGEVVVRGPNVMRGYWNKPDQTRDAFLDGGWYRTGDVGRLDGAGFLFLVDRAKDMIVSGGENVYCTEVEDAIYTHPSVLEAAVIGVPDERWGEAVHAVVVLRDGAEASEADLIEHCRGLIATYKMPKSVTFSTEALPKSGPGKILKRVLREPFWHGHDQAIH